MTLDRREPGVAEYDALMTSIRDGIGTITINRPAQRNALDARLLGEMSDALSRFEGDDDIGVVVFTGAGEKSFAAGADISEFTRATALDLLGRGMQGLYDEIEGCEKPTIAAVNGYALGGGCELAMACDIRIAADNARFGLPELALSIIPGAGGTQRLARLVGKGPAMEMILTGRALDAAEALRIGLVTRVCPPESLMGEVEETARTLLSKGPLALRLAKLAVNVGFETNQSTGLVVERLANAILFGTEDKDEGAQAFLQKRKPNFKKR